MKYLLYILCIGFSSYTFSQNSISGIVTDQNNNPLLGVEIYIEQLHIGTTSDENGAFELHKIPQGKIEVTFSYIGFESLKKIFTDKNENSSITIQLKETSERIDEVIIAAPFNKLQSENVMKIESRSIANLEKIGAPTLIQSLTAIPGVEQFSTGTGIGKPVIRGLTGNRVLVYTQGVRLENQQFGSEHGLGLNSAGIGSVEVIKGPASLLYGSDALGGVLYFNPEKFAYQGKTNADVSQDFFSNTLGSSTSIGVKTSKDVFKFLARGTYNTHADYKIPNGDRVTNTRFNEKDFKAGFGLNLKNFVTELRYNYNSANIGITEGIDVQTTSKTPLLPYQQINMHILSLHNHLFLANSKLDINLGYVRNERMEFEEEHDHHEEEEHEEEHEEEGHEEHHEEAALNMQLKTFTYEAKYHLPKTDKLETILGIQGLHQTNENFGEELLIPNAKTNDIGMLATAIYNFNDHHTLQGGLRYDYRNLSTNAYEIEDHNTTEVVDGVDNTYGNFTFSLGYKTNLFNFITTRINLASGYRAPNLAELTSYGVHHGTNRFEIGNPDLKSEQNLQTDISLGYNSEHLEVYANGFYNHINNYIYAAPTGDMEDGYPVYAYIQNNAKLYGGELGIHYHPHPIDWLHLESSFETVTGKKDNGDYLPLIPANKWANTFRGEFQINNNIKDLYAAINVDSYFSQNKVSNFEEKTDGYQLVNLRFGSTFSLKKSAIKVKLSLNNLLNKTYTSHLSALKFEGIPNAGRNIVVGLNWSI